MALTFTDIHLGTGGLDGDVFVVVIVFLCVYVHFCQNIIFSSYLGNSHFLKVEALICQGFCALKKLPFGKGAEKAGPSATVFRALVELLDFFFLL